MATQPPPTEFTWDTPISEIITQIYDLSPELLSSRPDCIMLYADRLQVNWQKADPPSTSTIEMAFTCRPVAPDKIVIQPRPAY